MTDEQDKSAEEETEAAPKGPRCGELLAEARRERQISVLEVAKELHLDEPKVRALERNDFDTLGAPVFAKGHLRKYAHLVGVDVDDVLTDYYQMTRQDTDLPPVVVARRRMRQELSPGPWIAVIIVIIVAAAAYWWFAVFSAQQAATQPAPQPATEPAPVEQQEVAETTTDPSESIEETQTVADDVAPEPEPVVAEPEPEPTRAPLAEGEVLLSMTFSGDCWTEVSDARGRRLFYRMGRNGETIDVAGVPPFAVLFGNVDNVAVTLDGNAYPISNTNPGSRMARLTINNQ